MPRIDIYVVRVPNVYEIVLIVWSHKRERNCTKIPNEIFFFISFNRFNLVCLRNGVERTFRHKQNTQQVNIDLAKSRKQTNKEEEEEKSSIDN